MTQPSEELRKMQEALAEAKRGPEEAKPKVEVSLDSLYRRRFSRSQLDVSQLRGS